MLNIMFNNVIVLLIIISHVVHVNCDTVKVVTGFTSKSVIQNLNPGNLQDGDEFGINVDIWSVNYHTIIL